MAALAEAALGGHVRGLALGGLDADRLVPPVPEVVRAGAHVQLPHVAGQLQAVDQQLAGRQRPEGGGYLVEVHGRVQAAGLLEGGAVPGPGPQGVQVP
ncbi:hypothetical protein BJF82_00765 [Kytococcus sp. CUA-901]|nr:hypothetical protein BJF82_00765 [Kytococcus sp. CUA-901]